MSGGQIYSETQPTYGAKYCMFAFWSDGSDFIIQVFGDFVVKPRKLVLIFDILLGLSRCKKRNQLISKENMNQRMTGWWFQPSPLKKYDFVTWDSYIPNINGKI